MDEKQLWARCVAFHGHACGGLTIGYKAALYAMALLETEFSEDERLVCVAENDACGVDAIQVLLGCSLGKGNLLLRPRGKQAFSFFDRDTGRAVRLMLKPRPRMSREESFADLQARAPEELFDVSVPAFPLPERARLWGSAACERCGEVTAEHMLRLENGRKLCLDCHPPYERFSL